MDTSSERTVSRFFAEYQDAVRGDHSEGLGHLAVRKRFFPTELDGALFAWEGEHKANLVFRRQDLPAQELRPGGDGPGGISPPRAAPASPAGRSDEQRARARRNVDREAIA
ncbi:hypothetical protein ACIGBH_25430 [Streptomyces sp. NPDC085929]|uniref:hypothetical protein n=1 Tax=Streptomyces sp. NPDC085929 TaxID=3365739 RepID=UPI0037D1873B